MQAKAVLVDPSAADSGGRPGRLVGRDGELDRLDCLLNGGGPLRAWIHSPPELEGIGKTALARAFLQRHRSRFERVLHVDTCNGLAAGLQRAGVESGLLESPGADTLRDARDAGRLLVRQRGTLLVIDGEVDAATVRSSLGARQACSLLLVGSGAPARDWATLSPAPLSPEEGAALIRTLAPDTGLSDPALETLAKATGGIPLELTLAARLLEERQCAPDELLQALEEARVGGFACCRPTLAAVVSVAMRSLSEEAAALLRFLAALAPAPLPIHLLQRGLEGLPGDPVGMGLPQGLRNLRAVVELLQQRALLEGEPSSPRIHAGIRTAVVGLAAETARGRQELAARMVEMLFPREYGPADWLRGEEICPHARHLVESLPDECEPARRLRLLAGGYLASRRRTDEAVRILAPALRDEGLEGDERLEAAMLQLADLHLQHYDLPSARETLRRLEARLDAAAEGALAGRDNSRRLCRVLSALGQIERRLTGPEAAREALARELALRDRLAAVSPECQEEALALCDTLNRLGDVEAELGQYSAARAYYARSLEIGEQVYQVSGGPEAAEPLCTALDGLELVELAQGHDEAARGFRVRCDELRRRILEAQPAHSVNAREVCRRLVEAGEEDVRDGRLATARGQLTRAAALLQRVMGAAEDPDEDAAVLLRVLELLSDLEEREGRWAVAAEARAKYAALLQNLARRDADDTLLRDVWLDAMGRVAELWSRAEQLETAREECARWVEAVRQAHRWDPGNAKLRLALSRSLEKLGTIELDRGRPGAAREALKEALDLARQDDGSDSETRLTPRDLASLHWNVGRSCVRDRPDAADASFRQCLALLEGIERSDERLDAEAVRVLGWLREHFAPAPAAELLPERPPVFRRLRALFGV